MTEGPTTTDPVTTGPASSPGTRSSATPAGPGQGRAETPGFRDHLRQTIQTVRATFLDMVTTAGGNPTAPQELSRQFGLDKSLTWKVSRVLQDADAETAASHLPGAAGLRIFIRAMTEAGADPATVEAASLAIQDFERMVEIHTTDRTTLDMLLTSLRAGDDPRRAESHRKQAYQGNSVIWGVQAKTRLATYFLAPSASRPGMLDIGNIGGLVGFRRLRADASWPIGRPQGYRADGTPVDHQREPFDPANVLELESNDERRDAVQFPMLRAFCSDPTPEVSAARVPGGLQFEIAPGPLGNSGVQTCLFGQVFIGAFPLHAEGADTHGEHPTRLFTPTEWLLCDLFVHESLPIDLPPVASLHGQLAAWEQSALVRKNSPPLPIAETVHALGPPPNVPTPLVPKYAQLLRTAFNARSWDPREFRGFRFQMRYPPIPAVLLLRYALPKAPAG